MDVRCNRCGTEYEFDDALISERGTTVKCTNCGFQFKVFPPGASSGAPERWVVRTTAGREFVYTSLRDLQRGIADRQVQPNDVLSRGNQPPRALKTIAELEPFFAVSGSASTERDARTPRTLHGVAPPANSIGGTFRQTAGREPPAVSAPPPAAGTPPRPGPISSLPPVNIGGPPRPRAEDPPSRAPLSATLPAAEAPPFRPSPTPAPVSQPASSPSPSPSARVDSRPASSRTLVGPGAFSATQPTPTAPSPTEASLTHTLPLSQGPETRPSTPQAQRASAPDHPPPSFEQTYRMTPEPRTPAPASVRESMHSYDELETEESEPELAARRARSRWIAAVVLAGMVGLVGLTVGRRYISRFSPQPAQKAERPVADQRVAQFLAEGNRLLDEGELEGAQEQFVKATALAEKDAAVLAALARLETLRADVYWLKLRLLDPNSQEIVQATHRELGRRVGKARSAVDRAFAIAPEDPSVLRARVDAMRLSGDSDKAREWVGPISSNSSQPENAYVLAALDLAEQNPIWSSVIDRLRTAAGGEREPGRARAALIYALARANRVSEAEAEFAKLEARAKPHALLDELKSFLSRFKAAADAGADAGKEVAAVDPGKLPALDTSPGPETEPKRAVAAAEPAGDFRTKLSKGFAAVRGGRLEEAEQMFNSVLAEQPGNVEAISGLGDVARRRGDNAGASKMYDRVLQQNPSYLPALLASADSKWDSGDRKGAVTLYRRVVEQAGPGSEYGARASARIAQSEAAATPPGGAAPAPSAAPAPASSAPGGT